MKVLAIAAALALPVLAISPVSVKGSKMFVDGKQWFMKGIAYQLTTDDPLANPSQCALDAALMKTIGTNTIRVYHVDPTANHDACMQSFADAGIYPWIDLDTFTTYILNQTSTSPEWTMRQYQAYSKVMDAFAKYDNVAGFFVGNEVMNSPETTVAAPYVKAAARDMKAYRDNKGYRNFPIGYTAADIAQLRPMLQNYLACGDASDAIDVFGLNAYEWCGNVNFMTSGYSGLNNSASGYNIPIFFSETGCNVPEPRDFADQAAILGPDMNSQWSGAIIYEWIQEANSYGLINYPTGTSSPAGTPTPLQPDFGNLSKQWATLTPTGVSASAYTPSLSAPQCPSFMPGSWSVSPDAVLPTIGQAYTGGAASASTSASTTQGSSSGASSQASGGATTTATATATTSGTAEGQAVATTTATTTSKAAATHAFQKPELAAVAALAFVPLVAIF